LADDGPHQEDLFGSLERAADILEESFGVIGVCLDTLVLLRVFMVNVVQRCSDGRLIDLAGVDGKHARFFMIDPNG
jgi:hypothetical protein